MADQDKTEIKTEGADTAGKSLSGGSPTNFPGSSTQAGENSSPALSSYVAGNASPGVTPAPKLPEVVGSLPTPIPATVPASLPPSAEQSPFFGKLAPEKAPTPLNVSAPTVETPLPAATPPSTPTSGVWSAPQKPTPPENTLRAEDKLHSGNIVSLLEEQEQKKSGVPVPQTGMKYSETPAQRSIREIGLRPRPQTDGQKKEETKPLQTKPGELPRIRTYAADMSEEIRRRGETLSTIISAERTKMGKGPVGDETRSKTELEANEKTRNTLLSFGAVFLVIVGIIGVAVVFFLTRPKPALPERTSLIPVNYAELVNLGAEDRTVRGLAELRQDTDLRLGEMKEFILTDGGTPVSAESILTRLGAPGILSRNATSLMIGIHAFDRNQPFILISISAYDRAFEGMLEWEKRIGETLGAFFAPYKGARNSVPTVPPPLTFTDRVYQNIDVRESNPEWKIMYAFPRRDLLLITTNESTIREVITRLTLQSVN